MKKSSFFLLAAGLSLAVSCTSQSPKTDTPAVVSSGAAKLENRFSDGVVGTHDVTVLNDLLGDDFISHHFFRLGLSRHYAGK